MKVMEDGYLEQGYYKKQKAKICLEEDRINQRSKKRDRHLFIIAARKQFPNASVVGLILASSFFGCLFSFFS